MTIYVLPFFNFSLSSWGPCSHSLNYQNLTLAMMLSHKCNVRHPFEKLMFQQKVLVDDVNHSKTWLWLKHTATKNAGREINTMRGIYKTPSYFWDQKESEQLWSLLHTSMCWQCTGYTQQKCWLRLKYMAKFGFGQKGLQNNTYTLKYFLYASKMYTHLVQQQVLTVLYTYCTVVKKWHQYHNVSWQKHHLSKRKTISWQKTG